MNERVSKVWNSVLKFLKDRIAEKDYNAWIVNMSPVDIDEKYFIVEVDNEFMKNRIEGSYSSIINEVINDILIDEWKEVKIIVKSYASHNENNNYNDYIESKPDIAKQKSNYSFGEMSYNLNSKYVFENFIVGKSNNFAHAACQAVSKSLGKVYNPLFIYGGVGLGKTHLMHAIGNYILSLDKNKKVYYCSSEQFTNDLIFSIKNDQMVNFRDKYRKLDLLLIDDIQFISGKESTQEEFFHTFNELLNAGKHIVISSDRPPEEMNNIEKRLVSRFGSGLISDIQSPDYETRVAILKKKADLERINIPEDVFYYIAETVNSNIRELEGALNRVVAKASLLNRNINVELVEEIFYDILKTKTKIVTKDKVLSVVSEYYNISLEEMKSSKRKQEIAKSRQVAMYFLRDMLQIPLASIGDIFGGKDHTTVMHSCAKIEEERKTNKSFDKDISFIREKIMS